MTKIERLIENLGTIEADIRRDLVAEILGTLRELADPKGMTEQADLDALPDRIEGMEHAIAIIEANFGM